MTEDFIWFIKNVIGKPCVISGHSSGGILATNVASEDPNDIFALVIEDSPYFCAEPSEMKKRNAFVWVDGFKVMNDFLNQRETDNYYYYYFKNGYMWSLFGALRNKVAVSALKYSKKHPGEQLKIWYLPQSILRGLYYFNSFDFQFGMMFYNGSWFQGTSQEDILKRVKCSCTYIKARTGYILDGKPKCEFAGRDVSKAVLCCANTDADAAKVTKLVSNCRRITTESSDHLIHCKYPDLFIRELVRYC